ncbi:potassium voltage-gated channel subfamily C member 1-like [Dendronephthya gigantea]|uniref:potassium voltage-gated channel subfamily C member 1-like n=1 Tax=Dendronephthya gigantea TaxID=151771 RepID=UPI001069818D|nr:potassium voltage-gated channel subfamily C member 1-like [Dendronephthya gigantea]
MNRLVQEQHAAPKFGSDGMERIRLNVGGQRHETYLSTVGNLPDTRLYSIIESAVKSPDYDPETTEVFFDRHPAVFAQVLNYYRTGTLHCPTDVCGPLFEQELNYWGIDEKDMEPCCWTNYTQHRDAEENLKNVLYEGTSEECVTDSSFISQQSEMTRLWKKIQPQVWATLDESRSSNRARVFSFVSVMFIVVSVAMFCVNTVPEVAETKSWPYFFKALEFLCGIWFTLEFLLRIVFCPDKVAFAKSWSTWIDFLAITPFYLKLFVTSHVKAIDALLVIRLLRLFRFFRLIYGLQVLSHTLKASSYELVLLLSMLVIPVILFSSIVFFIEDHFDKKNTKFRSIPHSFWWSLITITTVGYGDMHPVTWLGKVIGSMCAICGVLIVALPVSIIGSNFSLFYTHAQARLKLPKKKKNLFIQQRSTIYSERQLPRRRGAVRRKVSSRASDTCSFMMCADSRASSVQGYNLPNGTKAHSGVHDDNRSNASTGRVMKKKISSISIKIPSLESPCEENPNDQVEPSSRRGYSSFDSMHYVTRRRSLTTPPDGVVSNTNTAEEGESVESLACANNKDKRNVRFNGTQSSRENIPLLVEPSEPSIELRDIGPVTTEDSPLGVQSENMNNNQCLLTVEPEEYLGSPMQACESDSEQNASDLNDAEGCVSMKRVPRRRKDGVANWRRRPSSLESISEKSIKMDRLSNNVSDSGVEALDENILPELEVTRPLVHFNRGRRQPIF